MALSQAQDLHARASQIADPATKTAYLKELECVSGLLPYRDPRMSPMAHYLDERRRDVLAEAVNGAIMREYMMAVPVSTSLRMLTLPFYSVDRQSLHE